MKKNTPQLLITIGAPGSGKSTFSKYLVRTEDRWVRVNRDDFRAMQFEGSKASIETERTVNHAMDACIDTYLHKGYHVIIDATHCRLDYIQGYVKRFGHLADIHFKVFDLPFDTLWKRCKLREEQTGKIIPEQVLRTYVNELALLKTKFDFKPILKKERIFTSLQQSKDMSTCFLFDLDGTLAQANGRSMFNPSEEDILGDSPIEPVIAVLQSLEKQHQIIFLSGREDSLYQSTIQWIQQHIGVKEPVQLFMRKQGDFRRDSVIKKEILHEHILPNYRVLGAFDDRLQVVRECWNAEGIFCFNVNQLLEEF